MADWVRVAAKGDVAENACIGVRVGDKEIAVYHLEGGEFHATANVCSHEYALLTDGWLENGCKVRVGLTAHASFCVDTPADLEEARRRVAAR